MGNDNWIAIVLGSQQRRVIKRGERRPWYYNNYFELSIRFTMVVSEFLLVTSEWRVARDFT